MAFNFSQLTYELQQSEKEAKRNLASRFFEELPGQAKKTGKSILSFGKSVLRDIPRSAAQFTLKAQGARELKPETRGEKFLFGEETIKTPEETGTELLQSFGVSEFNAKKYGGGLGYPLALLGVTPFGGGKKKATETIGKKAIQEVTESGLTKKSISTLAQKLGKLTGRFVKETIEETPEQIFKQRRGILNNTQIAELAKGEIGILDNLLSAPPGTILPAEKSVAARQELADKVLSIFREGTPEKLGEIKKFVAPLVGVRSETGRALASYKIPTSEDAVRQLLEFAKKTPDNQLKESATEIAQLIGSGRLPNWQDKLVEWATAIKLTSPTTHFRNIGGNTFSTILSKPERFITGLVDNLRSTITGTKQERFAQEALADLTGTIAGFKEGASNAIKALIDENFAIREGRISEVISETGAIRGTLGKIIRAPFRVLSAEDTFFRTANQKGALYASATRRALQEGLSGTDMVKRIDDLVRTPDDALLKEAFEQSKKIVFQEDLSGFVKSLNNLREKHPFVKLILPFFKTPVNIFKAIVSRTPLTFALPSTLKTLKEGGAGSSEVFGRMITGSILMTSFINYAFEGAITGRGPQNKSERDALFRQGWQPYSIKLGDKYFSYRGYEPLTGYLGLAADVAEGFKVPSEENILKMLGGITGDLLDQPFLTGVSDLMETLNEPDLNAQRFFANFTSGVTIPTGISYFARIVDPVYRQPKGILQTLESRLPFFSDKVLPRRSAFGQEVTREGNIFARTSPIITTTEKDDPVEDELNRLGIKIGFPGKVAFGQSLNDEEYDTLLRVSGQTIKNVLDDLIQEESFQKLSDNEKERTINRVVDRVRERVRERTFKEKQLLREIENRLKKRGLSSDRAEMMAPEIMQKMISGTAQ